jgi:glycerol-3-phosphate dehydrogenase
VIFPVNYVVDRDLIVFRTDPGSKLDAATERESVAFEVDAVDEATRTGWSVVVGGTLADHDQVQEPAGLVALAQDAGAAGEELDLHRGRGLGQQLPRAAGRTAGAGPGSGRSPPWPTASPGRPGAAKHGPPPGPTGPPGVGRPALGAGGSEHDAGGAPRGEAVDAAQVIVVGGGGTGGALAHDLVLRGLRVTLLERGELTSGTTGRHHGLLHSGARYAVGDPASAVACIAENRILRRIAPGSFEENGGLFVALDDQDMGYLPGFLAGCAACGIPTRRLTPAEALALEPGLNPALRAAVRVPDATMDAMRLPLRFFATAQANSARLRPFCEVVGLPRAGRRVTGVAVRDRLTGAEAELAADLVVNATGPWCGRLAAMAGASVPVQPSAGVLLAVAGRLCDLVVNRLHACGDGDIVVPQRRLSIVGTSAWTVDDPDDLEVPDEHVRAMRREGAKLVPAVAAAAERAAWSAARPLIGPAGGGRGRELSRTFGCFDHAVTDGVAAW